MSAVAAILPTTLRAAFEQATTKNTTSPTTKRVARALATRTGLIVRRKLWAVQRVKKGKRNGS